MGLPLKNFTPKKDLPLNNFMKPLFAPAEEFHWSSTGVGWVRSP